MTRKFAINSVEQLYMLDIFLDRLNFMSNTSQLLPPISSLQIVFRFPYLPPMTVAVSESRSTNKSKNQLNTLIFDCGQSCIFFRRPENLRMLIKSHSLQVQMYRINSDAVCPENDMDDELIVCQANISLSDDLKYDQHDLVALETRRTCQLVNHLEEPVASLEIILKLLCHGDFIVNEFFHKKNALIFKNPKFPSEYQCSRVSTDPTKHHERNISEQYLNINKIRAKTVAGLSEACEYQFRRLFHSEEFAKDTRKVKSESKKCRSGLCWNKNQFPISMAIAKSNEIDWESSTNRLHGGGTKQNELTNTWINNKYSPNATPSRQTFPSDAARHDNQSMGRSDYEYYSRTAAIKSVKCLETPCRGIDCIVAALKDTENFVNNIGKVPGLAGLGLMDPRESPYFNRHSDKSANYQTQIINKSPTHTSPDVNKFSKPKLVNHHHDLTSNKVWKTENIVEESIDNYNLSQPINPIDKINLDLREKFDASRNNMTMDEPVVTMKRDKTIKSPKSLTKKSSKKLVSPSRGTLQSNNQVKVSKKIMKIVESAGAGTKRLCYGHRQCVDVRMKVPGNMGWLWNTRDTAGQPKAQLGWKPGAILRRVWRLLEDAKVEQTEQVIERPVVQPVTRGKKTKTRRRNPLLPLRGSWSRLREQDDEFELPPTLHIHRKKGTYYITMYPLKEEFINKPELQQTVKPLQFKVTKDKDDNSITSSSMASDMEFEFSPPVAVTNWRQKVETKDFNAEVTQQQILDEVVDISQLWKNKKRSWKTR